MVGVLGVLEQEEFVVGLLTQARGSDEEAVAFTVPTHGCQAPGLVLGPVDDRARVHDDDCVLRCVKGVGRVSVRVVWVMARRARYFAEEGRWMLHASTSCFLSLWRHCSQSLWYLKRRDALG